MTRGWFGSVTCRDSTGWVTQCQTPSESDTLVALVGFSGLVKDAISTAQVLCVILLIAETLIMNGLQFTVQVGALPPEILVTSVKVV